MNVHNEDTFAGLLRLAFTQGYEDGKENASIRREDTQQTIRARAELVGQDGAHSADIRPTFRRDISPQSSGSDNPNIIGEKADGRAINRLMGNFGLCRKWEEMQEWTDLWARRGVRMKPPCSHMTTKRTNETRTGDL
jgi:hypothetical protein